MTAICLLRAYVDARLNHTRADRYDDQVLEYAQEIVSTASQEDGLY